MSKASVYQEWMIRASSKKIPAALWLPLEGDRPYPLVMVGHGGSGHKTSNLVLDIVNELVEPLKIAVLAIDGPVHGARRVDSKDGAAVRQEFRDLWSRGGEVDSMVEDWRAALDDVCSRPDIDSEKIAWYGISMGTAYGVPVIAADSRIGAAVLGMWGTCLKPSERLEQDAINIHIPVLFQTKLEDEIFTEEGQNTLFNLLKSSQKRIVKYPGGHTDPKGAQLKEAVEFLQTYLVF
jgi:cephalosporin-C deacetylase-like acetyl esterase